MEICSEEFVCFSQKSVGVITLTSTRGSSRSRSKDLEVVICLDADLFTHLAGLPPLGGVKDPRKRNREKSRVQRQECQQMAPQAQERTVSVYSLGETAVKWTDSIRLLQILQRC